MRESTMLLYMTLGTLLLWVFVYPEQFTGVKPDIGDLIITILVSSYFITHSIENVYKKR